MSKYTAGPWTYREGSEPHHQSLVYPDGDGFDIAVCYHDEGGANARLISAAPDLLAACKLALREHKADCEAFKMNNISAQERDRLNDLADTLENAISKAEGEL